MIFYVLIQVDFISLIITNIDTMFSIRSTTNTSKDQQLNGVEGNYKYNMTSQNGSANTELCKSCKKCYDHHCICFENLSR